MNKKNGDGDEDDGGDSSEVSWEQLRWLSQCSLYRRRGWMLEEWGKAN